MFFGKPVKEQEKTAIKKYSKRSLILVYYHPQGGTVWLQN